MGIFIFTRISNSTTLTSNLSTLARSIRICFEQISARYIIRKSWTVLNFTYKGTGEDVPFLTLTSSLVHKTEISKTGNYFIIYSCIGCLTVSKPYYNICVSGCTMLHLGGMVMNVPIKILVEGSLCVALSIALSFVKLFALPQGGSVSLGMLPIFIFAIRRGGTAGISAGLTVGLLRLFLGGYVVHPLQALLDYPVASALLGAAGFFRTNRYFGVVAAAFLNLSASVLSGAIFFSEYAPEGMNVWLYSLLYNASVVIPEAVISMALIYFILPRLDKIGR